VEGYRVHYGSEPSSYTSHVDVGIPSKDDSGAFVYELEVPASEPVYVAVTAYDRAGLESDFSNEKVRAAPIERLGRPGQPVPVLD
jgi:hypothetical protein